VLCTVDALCVLDVACSLHTVNWLSVVLLGCFKVAVGRMPSVACWMN
jgi:hypothetical protein